jgi:transcriptional regulator with XRE-family HTH domain
MNNLPDENNANLAKVLTHLASKKGLTSSELARQTGIAQPVIYRLMTGVTENPQILTLKPIADYFEISIDQLLGSTSLNGLRVLDNELLHDVTNNLITIKTISTILIDVMPGLIEGYQKAVVSHLIKETTSLDILPLLQINTANLLKAANLIQKLLIENDRNS